MKWGDAKNHYFKDIHYYLNVRLVMDLSSQQLINSVAYRTLQISVELTILLYYWVYINGESQCGKSQWDNCSPDWRRSAVSE